MYERFTKMVDSESSSSEVLDQSGVNDTVGAVALDMDGRVASTVSSGGNWLKQSGRIGHVS
jgi:isoaspartyl peptidase/L-asparaginase-like protein (Ntn-hydrolase superfamily)